MLVRKRDAQSCAIRHKAHLTVKGFQQRFGVNYWETYAPVAVDPLLSNYRQLYSAQLLTKLPIVAIVDRQNTAVVDDVDRI